MTDSIRERTVPYDLGAPKRPANVTVNADLLRRAREFELNLSQVLEKALADQVAVRVRERWLAENRAAIEAYNREIEQHGCFSDSLRGF
ncbi:MAG TPA: type II toxin-antitoxin system CcdA family antitoxin [Burkholderiaceae bacterium]|nr:type II toxin-antitoxin system CcdA family antitoxin [Burkholderiaceae bacterium]